jgi:hypothetical protein
LLVKRRLNLKREVRNLARPKIPAPIVEETTKYQNLVDASPTLLETAPPPPANKAKRSAYPHKLNIHLNSLKDCLAFARLINLKLESDKKSFVFTAGSTTKPENWTFVEKRKKPFGSKTTHTERLEAQLWKEMVEFSNDPDCVKTFGRLAIRRGPGFG